MTTKLLSAEERAINLVGYFMRQINSTDCVAEATKQIQLACAEATAEALEERGRLFQENVANFPKELKESRAEGHADGRLAGLEEAAKIASGLNYEVHPKCGRQVAKVIRALKAK